MQFSVYNFEAADVEKTWKHFELYEAEARMRSVLKCGTAEADPGCKVTIRYLAQVIRTS